MQAPCAGLLGWPCVVFLGVAKFVAWRSACPGGHIHCFPLRFVLVFLACEVNGGRIRAAVNGCVRRRSSSLRQCRTVADVDAVDVPVGTPLFLGLLLRRPDTNG